MIALVLELGSNPGQNVQCVFSLLHNLTFVLVQLHPVWRRSMVCNDANFRKVRAVSPSLSAFGFRMSSQFSMA